MGNVREKRGKLFFDFRYQGVRCREYTKLRDTPSNRKRMQKILDQIEQAIVTGTFQYADFFPGSKLVQRFADGGASQAVSLAQPATATMASGIGSLPRHVSGTGALRPHPIPTAPMILQCPALDPPPAGGGRIGLRTEERAGGTGIFEPRLFTVVRVARSPTTCGVVL